ncbi:PTS sugar transporter subunit IIA [Hydrogenophaga sp. SL48]|uniref:PTS sugar transporter subunit IIA n=1 Tax=Hydrogenophaga sp. SL48 TaxID=2806347 RepID=UPI001F2FAC19|nr:PTS sugar transporter subunit IIA [Hydrogenophaga sp. SL48]UJW83408.1 PTS sugar transporter subunit IIA [Hydrogenophaga sp. SL48]
MHPPWGGAVHLPGSRNVIDLNQLRLDVEARVGVALSDTTELFKFVDNIVSDGRRVRTGAVARQLALRQVRRGTSLGGGVAVPHAAVRRLPRARLIYIQLQAAITMDAPDHEAVRDVLALLVRYPPSLADHALLDCIRDPDMNPVLIDLLRRGRCAEVVERLARAA